MRATSRRSAARLRRTRSRHPSASWSRCHEAWPSGPQRPALDERDRAPTGRRTVSLQKDVEVLRSIPLFAKIEPAKLKLLAFTSEHLEFAEGDTLCRQGEAGDAAFIVLEGQADVLVENPGGAVKVATIHRNDI